MIIKEAIDAYIHYLQFEKDAPATEQTIETAKKRLKQVHMAWQGKEIEQISLEDIIEFKKELLYRNCTLNYIRCYFIVLRSFFKFCTTKTICLNYQDIKPPNVSKNDVNYLTIEEVNKMIEFLTEDTLSNLRNKAMIQILLDTGMRIHECVALNRDTINFETKTAVIIGKGKKIRMVMFTDWSLNTIKKYLESRKDNDNALFVTHTIYPFIPQRLKQDGFRDFLRTLSRKMGKKITPHMLRRTAATTLRNNGADILMIKEFLGHENLATTNRYLGIDYERLKKEHAKFMVY